MLDVRKLLAQRPLLFDGGMGTYYKAKPGQECEQANLTDPEGILAVHRAYLAAGADAIKTNTFSLPRLAAAQQPGWEQLADAGWQLAVKAAGETGAAVFADLGPAPDTENLPAEQVYLAVAKRFALLGARNFLFETLSAEDGVLEAIRALKQTVPEAFVLVSFAVLPDGYTREGRYCADLVRRMAQSGVVDAVGLNCVSAPGAMRALVQQLGDAGLPLSVMPNAGYPVVARAQVRYQGKPEYFARELSRLASEGVRILGGCCGTTPQHIAALRTALDALPEALPAAPAAKPAAAAKPAVETDDAFLRKLRIGQRVIAVELDSPKDADLTAYLEGARRLQAAGADHCGLPHCPGTDGFLAGGLPGAPGAGHERTAPHDLQGPQPERYQSVAAGAVRRGRAGGTGYYRRPHPHRRAGRGEKCVPVQLPQVGTVYRVAGRRRAGDARTHHGFWCAEPERPQF